MLRRSRPQDPPASTEPSGPVFVDDSGRRLRRVRLVGALALAGVAAYLGLMAMAFLGVAEVSMPFLPNAAAPADRERPTVEQAPAAVRPEPSAPGPDSAPDAEMPPAADDSTTTPVVVEDPPPGEPSVDEPGKSDTAPGQTHAPEPPTPGRP